MKNSDIYKILDRLGMVSADDLQEGNEESTSLENMFETKICRDIVALTNFVDDLFIMNDENYIKKFLVCMLFENANN